MKTERIWAIDPENRSLLCIHQQAYRRARLNSNFSNLTFTVLTEKEIRQVTAKASLPT